MSIMFQSFYCLSLLHSTMSLFQLNSLGLLILAVISILIFVGIYCPFLAYYAYKTYQHRNNIIMRKRNPRLTIMLALLSILWILSFVLIILIYCFGTNDITNRTLTNLSSFAIIAIYLCFTHTLIWRLWLTYFELMRSVSLLKMSWHQIIAPKSNESDDWYLSTEAKATWGNPNYLKKVVLSTMFCHILIYALVFFIFGSITFILRLLLIFAPWIGIYFLYRKIPRIHDEIGIATGQKLSLSLCFSLFTSTSYCKCIRVHIEIKNVMIGYSLMGIMFVVVIITILIKSSASYQSNRMVIDIVFGLSMHLIAGITFITSMIMIWWPLKRYLVVTNRLQPTESNSTSTKVTTSTLALLKLEDIMFSMTAIDLLMKSLENEWSHENLLFQIEIALYQHAIYDHLKTNHYQAQYQGQGIDLNGLKRTLLNIPETIPKSKIIHDSYTEIIEKYANLKQPRILSLVARQQLRLKHIAYLLYQKYIVVSSELSVNISGKQRDALDEKLENYDEWMKNKAFDNISALFFLFEDARQEIEYLINGDSITRMKFNDEEQYNKMESIVLHQKETNNGMIGFITNKLSNHCSAQKKDNAKLEVMGHHLANSTRMEELEQMSSITGHNTQKSGNHGSDDSGEFVFVGQ